MRTPDEIKKGLECCNVSTYQCKTDCPYKEGFRSGICWVEMNKDALALIQQKEQENADLVADNGQLLIEVTLLQAKVRQLEAERDAAVAGLKSNCTCPECKYFSDEIQEPCRSCKPNDSKFEWRGVQKEE